MPFNQRNQKAEWPARRYKMINGEMVAYDAEPIKAKTYVELMTKINYYISRSWRKDTPAKWIEAERMWTQVIIRKH
jgi:hypothetical protein